MRWAGTISIKIDFFVLTTDMMNLQDPDGTCVQLSSYGSSGRISGTDLLDDNPEARGYPSEQQLRKKFNNWTWTMYVFTMVMLFIAFIMIFYRNKCELEELKKFPKFQWIQPVGILNYYMVIEWMTNSVILGIQYKYNRGLERLFRIPKMYFIFHLITTIAYIFIILTLSGIWSKCPPSNLGIIIIALMYRPIVMVAFGYALWKYPLLKKRIVWNREDLEPFDR